MTLTTTDDLGVTGTTTEQITVDAPAAAFTIAPNTPAPGSSVSFDASGSTDPEGTITDYSWNFGDGTPVQDAGGSAAVQHTFASRGTYTVALTVTNNYGQTSTSTHTVTVDDPPTATFTPSAAVVAPGATVDFEASASAPGGPDGAITSYSWNFGDGSAVAAGGGTADASHTFESPGTYTVTLTTTDDLGVSTTTTEQITVSAPTPPGVITVTPTPPAPTPLPRRRPARLPPRHSHSRLRWRPGRSNGSLPPPHTACPSSFRRMRAARSASRSRFRAPRPGRAQGPAGRSD